MQISSIPTNSSLQNNPRYQFSLKSETFDDFVGSHFEIGGLVKITLNEVRNWLVLMKFAFRVIFNEATIFKMAANTIVELSMVSDFNEN
jgi:hypothetical protein